MSINRRSLFMAAGAAAGSLMVGRQAAAAEAAPAFKAPTKDNPIIISFNENPLGMSAKARQAVADAAAKASRYPFARVEKLRRALADYVGGKPENILLSHGSAESIRAGIEAYAAPGVQLVIPELTYGDGEDVAKRNSIRVTKCPMLPDWQIDIGAMKKAVADWYGPSIVYFVNPNNPTSTVVDSKELFAWIRSKPQNTMFIIDEAYAEFVEDPKFESCAKLVAEGLDNVVVLKTFSKIFAMAGMRVGYAYAQPAVIKMMRDHVAYDIMMNACSIEAALAEVTDKAFIEKSRSENAKARKILNDVLDELKIHHLPSQTNFVFADLKAPLKPFAQHMRDEHIWVGRPFPPAVQWCRISLGTPAEMTYFANKLREFRAKGWV